MSPGPPGGEGTHRPLDEVDAGLQVQAEVDEAPLNALPLVLLLLQDEHGVVEQLLQPLVGVVDAQLLERVQLRGRTGAGDGVKTRSNHPTDRAKPKADRARIAPRIFLHGINKK